AGPGPRRHRDPRRIAGEETAGDRAVGPRDARDDVDVRGLEAVGGETGAAQAFGPAVDSPAGRLVGAERPPGAERAAGCGQARGELAAGLGRRLPGDVEHAGVALAEVEDRGQERVPPRGRRAYEEQREQEGARHRAVARGPGSAPPVSARTT